MKTDPRASSIHARPSYHRRSIRLKGYDYTQVGAYFITLVTRRREPIFGEILAGEMRLSPMGRIADEDWRAIPGHFPGVELGAYVIMPNHIHGILILTDGSLTGSIDRWGTIYRAPTTDLVPTDPVPNGHCPGGTRPTTQERFQKPVKGSIPTIIRTYKAFVSRRISKEFCLTGLWQRNYYERVIRDEEEYQRIHLYIEANVDQWPTDDDNSCMHTALPLGLGWEIVEAQ